jgi:hypothetical protein
LKRHSTDQGGDREGLRQEGTQRSSRATSPPSTARLAKLTQAKLPATATSALHLMPPQPSNAPDFVTKVTAHLMAGEAVNRPGPADLGPGPLHRLRKIERTKVRHDTVKGVSQFQPLFEFSGVCLAVVRRRT